MNTTKKEGSENNTNGTETNQSPVLGTNAGTAAPAPSEKYNIPPGTEFVPGNGKDLQDGFKWILCTGRECIYRKILGYGVRMAQRIAGSDESLMTFALLSQALTIDGNPVTVEELDLMPDDEIFEIMEKRQLFTLARKK